MSDRVPGATTLEERMDDIRAVLDAVGSVKDLVAGPGLEFEDRGTAELKGIPGEWRLFAVRS